MINIAVMSDIHSNYHAFRSCYQDALRSGAEQFIFLGDYVSDLALSRETLDLVYHIQSQYPATCLLGNRERYMTECRKGARAFYPGSHSGSLLYTYQQLREADWEFFEPLRGHGLIDIDGTTIEIAHAAAKDDRCYFDQNSTHLPEIFSEMKTRYLLTGHSHKQYTVSREGKAIINPGSVGIPQSHGTGAQYALLTIADGIVQCQLKQIPYDISAAITSQFESELMEIAPYWAISILYDIITGREYTMALLTNVRHMAQKQNTTMDDETLWHHAAKQMGMVFNKKELLSFYLDIIKS